MAIGKEAVELAKKIDYTFTDLTYLETALTHSSYTNEMRKRGIKASSNERLEFLGDAVLEIVISEYLYSNFSKYREGALTKMRQQLVCEQTLCKIATELGLGDYLNLGNCEDSTDLRHRPKILADALEALIAAVYLDSATRNDCSYKNIILSLFLKEINSATNQRTDYKTMLQQLSEQEGSALLEYRVVSEDGPEHDKLFTVEAIVNNNVVGRGSAQTKKAAEMQAAKMALKLFGVVV